MSLRTLGLSAGFALAANAFMIPSTISLPQLNEKVSGWPSLDITRLVDVNSRSRIAKLPCSECPFPVQGEQDVWTTDIPNSLVFDFTLSDDGKAVVLNGERIYPVDHAIRLKAPQVATDVADKDLYTSLDTLSTPPRQLNFELRSRTVEAADGTDAQLIDIDLHVSGINGHSKNLGDISARLLRDTDGTITIVDVENVPARGGPKPPTSSPNDNDETIEILPVEHNIHKSPTICGGRASFICSIVQAMENKMAAVRNRLSSAGSHGRRPCPGKAAKHGVPTKGGVPLFAVWKFGPKPFHASHVPGSEIEGGAGDFRDMMIHHGDDGHRPHHHSHGHGHREGSHFALHRLARGLRYFFFGFIVPVLIGVAAGMAASALGMVVGTFLAWAWIKFVRGGRRHTTPQIIIVDTDEVAHSNSDEKAGLMTAPADEDLETAPPVYAEKE